MAALKTFRESTHWNIRRGIFFFVIWKHVISLRKSTVIGWTLGTKWSSKGGHDALRVHHKYADSLLRRMLCFAHAERGTWPKSRKSHPSERMERWTLPRLLTQSWTATMFQRSALMRFFMSGRDYIVECDYCGKDKKVTASQSQLRAHIEADGWHAVGDKFLCPTCFSDHTHLNGVTLSWTHKRLILLWVALFCVHNAERSVFLFYTGSNDCVL